MKSDKRNLPLSHSWTPFDGAPVEYQNSFRELWPQVHAAIGERDLYAIETDRRLGMISNLAMYLVDSWPASLKTFLYRKYGEGCVTEAALTVLLTQIDRTASQARLQPLDQVQSEQMKPAQ